jgi:uncharacterized membrane protein YwaF
LPSVNYGFLLHKPAASSILDYLSDAPWLYIVELQGLALLYAPFAIADLRKRLRSA